MKFWGFDVTPAQLCVFDLDSMTATVGFIFLLFFINFTCFVLFVVVFVDFKKKKKKKNSFSLFLENILYVGVLFSVHVN